MLGYGEAQVSIPESLPLIQSVNTGIGIIAQTETWLIILVFLLLSCFILDPLLKIKLTIFFFETGKFDKLTN